MIARSLKAMGSVPEAVRMNSTRQPERRRAGAGARQPQPARRRAGGRVRPPRLQAAFPRSAPRQGGIQARG
eukprot:2045438-Lingulodinium_polyedra.AAC.1